MKYGDMLKVMGQIVTVHSLLEAEDHVNGEREWVSKPCEPWSGWVTGFTRRMNGRYVPGQTNWFSESTPPRFDAKSAVPCALVVSWPTMKPKLVPVDGYELGGTPTSPDNGGWKGMTEEVRQLCIEDMRQEASIRKRGAMGRFVKSSTGEGA